MFNKNLIDKLLLTKMSKTSVLSSVDCLYHTQLKKPVHHPLVDYFDKKPSEPKQTSPSALLADAADDSSLKKSNQMISHCGRPKKLQKLAKE